MHRFWSSAVAAAFVVAAAGNAAPGLAVSANETLEMQGLSVLVHQMNFHPVFKDEKNAGIQIILHGERIATDGEVRLMPTPTQWDPVPTFVSRVRGPKPDQLTVTSGYPELAYKLVVTAEGRGFRVAVNLDKPLPADLVGKAGFNLDFLPTSYFGKSYILGSAAGVFPRHPGGPIEANGDPAPLASGGNAITLSPEDPLTRVTIVSDSGPVMLYDARNKAQNGWFVVRTLIPAGKSENALVWHVRPNVIKNWVRPPVVSFNQAGYTPERDKVAVIELDPHMKAPAAIALMKIGADGKSVVALKATIKPWGKWKRYSYAKFDFSSVRTPGVYAIAYAGKTFDPFPIGAHVYDSVWHASLDTYLAEQMDHVQVREGYRVWHGPSHLDDARQAPPNHVHFDGYEMGPNLDSPFQAGEHIPGLAVGGWFDAGDFDIRTESQSEVIRDLAYAREAFGLDWDDLSVDEAARSVVIRRPDGVPDVLEQIKHGTIQLLAQYKVFGHAIPGIIAPTLQQYTHLGDAGSKTDRMIYDAKMGPLDSDGVHSGLPDDRLAFTTHTTGLNYMSAAALAAASTALHDLDPAMADEAFKAAVDLWTKEQHSAPVVFGTFNTTGGRDPKLQEISATIELVLATKGAAPYSTRLKELLPDLRSRFLFLAGLSARAIPYMDADYRAQVEGLVRETKARVDGMIAGNPFGVPISEGTWAGSHFAAMFAAQMYMLHQAFPDIIGRAYTLDGFDYVLGRHPANNLSLVSGVGTNSKLVGYGNNRADYTFIPGGMVPGVLIIKPDFPELKTAWPFLWYENEYVIGTATTYIVAANAAARLAAESPRAASASGR